MLSVPDPLRTPEMLARFGDPDEEHPGGFTDDAGVLHKTKRGAIEAFLAREAANARPASFVYFIQAGSNRAIKIGVARDPRKRLSEIQVGCPYRCRILAVMPGGRAEEAALHAQFAAHRLEGEWFRPGPEVKAAAQAARKEHRQWL